MLVDIVLHICFLPEEAFRMIEAVLDVQSRKAFDLPAQAFDDLFSFPASPRSCPMLPRFPDSDRICLIWFILPCGTHLYNL